MEEKSNKELTLIRVFDAPRELVFKAWTDPQLVKQWWGPNGVTNRVNDWDSKSGGKINLVMIAGSELGPLAGQEWPMEGKFKEINPPSELVFTANAIASGKEILEHETRVIFEEENGKTKMTVHVQVTKTTPEAAGPLQGMEMGWNQQLDKLVTFISQQK